MHMLQLSMPSTQLEDVLRRIPFLRNLDQADIEVIAGQPREQFQAGEQILPQGAHPDALRIILDGEVELLATMKDGSTEEVARLVVGDAIGDVELVYRQPTRATYRATVPTETLRWDRQLLNKFMGKHAAALDDLQFIANTKKLAQSVQFDWLAEDETIFGLTRKHNALLFQSMMLPVLFVGGALILLGWGITASASWPQWIGGAVLIAGALLTIWQWLDWRNDYYLITSRRVVWLEKVIAIYDSRREAPLHTILSVSVTTDVGGRAIGFGDVIVRTYTGEVPFRGVPSPHTFAALIEEHWRRLRAKQDETDREALQEALDRRLKDQEDSEPEDAVIQQDAPDTPAEKIGLDEWGFKVRFTSEGVITYRKHWAALLQKLILPSVLVLVLIGLIGLRAGGVIEIADLTSAIACMSLALIPLFAWWAYQYADWVNDLYQITPDQIIDINKKPLAREVRKVAPIVNILGTEVDRKGVLGLLLNYGDVVANVGTTQFVFQGVYDPVGVQQDIVNAQGELLRRKDESERQRRRSEMVELIDIYHDEFASSDRDEADLDPEDDHTNDRYTP